MSVGIHAPPLAPEVLGVRDLLCPGGMGEGMGDGTLARRIVADTVARDIVTHRVACEFWGHPAGCGSVLEEGGLTEPLQF